jgi:hypothetical protein
MRHGSSSIWGAVAVATVLSASASAQTSSPPSTAASSTTSPSPSAHDAHVRAFGPFDAGAARDVSRKGTRGLARRAHPAVGSASHIPGGGPPPPGLRYDPDLPETATVSPNAAPGLSSNPLYLAALFYANFLTRTDGPRCQHLPTCSRFASQAVGRYGVLGIPMGLDRVIQPPQSSALRSLPDVPYGESVRHWDPVENYIFWDPSLFTGLPPATPEEPIVFTVLTGDDVPPVPVAP